MNRKLIACIVALLGFFSVRVMAQDCTAIVLPHYGWDESLLPFLDEEKMQWQCDFSCSSYFLADEVEEGSVVLDITDLVFLRTGNHLSSNFVVDENTFSYYAYNINELQVKNFGKKIYFRLHAGNHQYLAFYSYNEIMQRVEERQHQR